MNKEEYIKTLDAYYGDKVLFGYYERLKNMISIAPVKHVVTDNGITTEIVGPARQTIDSIIELIKTHEEHYHPNLTPIKSPDNIKYSTLIEAIDSINYDISETHYIYKDRVNKFTVETIFKDDELMQIIVPNSIPTKNPDN